MEEQEDELLALHSILGSEEFVREEAKPAGEIRVSVELPADFTVALTEGKQGHHRDLCCTHLYLFSGLFSNLSFFFFW